MTEPNLLAIPVNAAKLLLTSGGVHLCRPLRASEFASFCSERGIRIDESRLLRFERLGIFSPWFRVYPSKARSPLRLPLTTNRWFAKGYAVDTSRGDPHTVPEKNGDEGEAYYSRFQLASLSFAVSAFTVPVHLESLLDGDGLNEISWTQKGAQMRNLASMHAARSGPVNGFRPAVDLLCQFISDRYYPQTRTNQRTLTFSSGGFSSDDWMVIDGLDWEWNTYARSFDPQRIEKAFDLSPAKLKHAYEALASQQAFDDPLERWQPLVRFVSPRERDRLKGRALGAETMRAGALMLGLLYRDLYGRDLAPLDEVKSTVIIPVPERAARDDVRRHMELVVNRFDLNPAPKLTLFVEGASEAVATGMIFERYFGAPAGTHQIEIVNLGGVETATGAKKQDRYRAILRLVDYLHHHQTFCFLILDNEGSAGLLKKAARDFASTLHSNRHAMRPENIRIWQRSFEFDNFSATEIAKAMSALTNGIVFTTAEIVACRKAPNSGAALSDLYTCKTAAGLNKINLARQLVERIFDPSARRTAAKRPLIQTLERVVRLAARNPFPTMEESWARNQLSGYFGKIRTRVSRRPPGKRGKTG